MLAAFRKIDRARNIFAILTALAVPVVLHATERRFTFTYEATTAPKGMLEIENSVSWNSQKRADSFDFRHEFEFGVTDRFQAALYVADWSIASEDGDDRRARYSDSAVELIYNLTNPTSDFLGSAIYGEIKVGDRLVELEGKLILQKNLGPLIVAYNAALEAQWEGSQLAGRTGEFQQTLGLSYEVTPRFTIGAELLHEVEWPEWSAPEPSRVFAGPNASIRYRNWWITVTPLFQITDQRDEPDAQTRVIVGLSF